MAIASTVAQKSEKFKWQCFSRVVPYRTCVTVLAVDSAADATPAVDVGRIGLGVRTLVDRRFGVSNVADADVAAAARDTEKLMRRGGVDTTAGGSAGMEIMVSSCVNPLVTDFKPTQSELRRGLAWCWKKLRY